MVAQKKNESNAELLYLIVFLKLSQTDTCSIQDA